jgi:PAS domain S-box-containing protein
VFLLSAAAPWTVLGAAPPSRLPVLTNAAQVRALSVAEAKRGYPVRLRGVITYSDPGGYMLFVQDATAGIYVDPPRGATSLQHGHLVELVGVSAPGRYTPILANPKISVLQPAPLPAPKAVAPARLITGAEDCHWVEVDGLVRAAVEQEGRLTLQLRANGVRFGAVVLGAPKGEPGRLIGAKLRLQGVCATAANDQRQPLGVAVMAPAMTFVKVSEPAFGDAFALELQAIERLARLRPSEGAEPPVRIRATVIKNEAERRLIVQDETGQMMVENAFDGPVAVGTVVEVVGYPTARAQGMGLEDCSVRRVGSAPQPALFGPEQTSAKALSGKTLPILTRVEQIRRLSKEEAEEGYPVRLRGLITYFDREWGVTFFHDGAEGVYAHVADRLLDLQPGQLVILHGHSAPGDFAPIVAKPWFEVLSSGPLPPAQERLLSQLMAGEEDSQWIAVRGVVRSLANDAGRLRLELAAGTGRLQAIIPAWGTQPLPRHLVDSRVRLEGACGSLFNRNRQFLAPQLFIPSLEHVLVQKPAPLDPFAAPVRAISSLLQFQAQAETGHRVRVRGVVTLQRPGGNLFVEEATGGLFAETWEAPVLQPGDEVDVLGFPAVGEYTPILQRAIVRKSGTGTLPPAPKITYVQVLEPKPEERLYDARLVQVEARLLRLSSTGAEDIILTLQEGQWVFNAHLPRQATSRPPTWPDGAMLRLTGVCSVQVDESRTPRSFRLLLRSPADVVVLAAPPWLTSARVKGLLTAATAAGIIILGWLLALQVRVRRQTVVIRQQLQEEVALEKRYQELFENASDAVYLMDLEGNILSFNHTAEQLTGYQRATDLPIHFSKIVAPEFVGLVQEKLQRKLRGETDPPFEIEILTKDGRRLALEINTRLVRKGNQPVSLHGVARDVTQRRRAERRSKAFAALGHRLSAAATVEEAAHIIVETAEELMGWDACVFDLGSVRQDGFEYQLVMDTMDGQKQQVDTVYPPGQASPMVRRVLEEGPQLILREAASPGPTELRPFGSGRRSASLLFVPIRCQEQAIGVLSVQSYAPNAYGQQDLAALQMLADLAGEALERIRSEEALRESEARKTAILESALDCVLTVDEEGRIIEANSATEQTFGYRRAELLGASLAERLVPPALREGVLREFKLCGNRAPGQLLDRRVEMTGQRADGAQLPVELSVIRIPLGGPPMFTVVLRDITERLSLEHQLRQAQRLESVGQLAAGVAHEFNNILAIIRGYADLLAGYGLSESETREALQRISTATERAAGLTQQLLAFSRKQIMHQKVVDLTTAISRLVRVLCQVLGEHITVEFSGAASTPPVFADPGMIEQVVMNLAVNARDAMPRGGRLRIELSAARLTEEQARHNPEARAGHFACLTVSDTGVGMDQQTLSRIFEPFYTTKEVGKGTGLGLATVYGIVKQHEGWIEVTSELNQGASFRVFLPAHEETVEARPPRSVAPVPGGHETVLVVEDEPALRGLICEVLRRRGYAVLAAGTGVQALERAAAHPQPIDVLVTDMVMPEGMNGGELAERLRAKAPQLRVIYTSGYSAEILAGQLPKHPGCRFLPKPYPASTLTAAIREVLNEELPPTPASEGPTA